MLLRYFKLSTGDEYIAQLDDVQTEYDLRTLHNPWRLLLSNHGYVPCPMPAKNLTLNSIHILLEGEVDDELARVYREKISGIASIPKNIVI